MNAIKSIENRIRGWFPKEPSVPSSKIAAKVFNPPKAVRIGIMVTILALMVIVTAMFFVPFMAEVRVIIWVIRVLMLTGIVAVLVVYYKRHGRIGREDSASGQILRRVLIGWRVRAKYPISFGLGTGFMLSAAVVLILGQPLPITYSLLLFFAFIGIGAVIGDLIGKKVDYRWPIWAPGDVEAE